MWGAPRPPPVSGSLAFALQMHPLAFALQMHPEDERQTEGRSKLLFPWHVCSCVRVCQEAFLGCLLPTLTRGSQASSLILTLYRQENEVSEKPHICPKPLSLQASESELDPRPAWLQSICSLHCTSWGTGTPAASSSSLWRECIREPLIS